MTERPCRAQEPAADPKVMDPIDPPNPDDLKNPLVADFLRRELPEKLVEVNGHPMAAPKEQPQGPPVLTREQLVDEVLARLRKAYLQTPERLAAAIREALELALLQQGIDREAVRVNNPYNSMQVRYGGFSMLHTCTTVKAAEVMKVDATALGQELAQLERVREFRAVIEPVFQIVDANDTQALSRVATRVDRGLELGWSTIQNNGELLRLLQPALAVRGKPAQAAAETRASNERRDEAVRTDTEARLQGQAQPEARPQVTATVTTTPTPPLMPAPRVTPGKKP